MSGTTRNACRAESLRQIVARQFFLRGQTSCLAGDRRCRGVSEVARVMQRMGTWLDVRTTRLKPAQGAKGARQGLFVFRRIHGNVPVPILFHISADALITQHARSNSASLPGASADQSGRCLPAARPPRSVGCRVLGDAVQDDSARQTP